MFARLSKWAGADHFDMTCIVLYLGLTLGLFVMSVAVYDAWLTPANADFIDVSTGLTLVLFGCLASFLALRGNTYDERRGGRTWYSHITREGRAAILIMGATAMVWLADKVLTGRHQAAKAEAEMAEANGNLAAHYEKIIAGVTGKLASADSALKAFLKVNYDSMSVTQRRDLGLIAGRIDSAGVAADNSALQIRNDVDRFASESNALLHLTLDGVNELANPDSGLFQFSRRSNQHMQVLGDTLYQVRDSVISLSLTANRGWSRSADWQGTALDSIRWVAQLVRQTNDEALRNERALRGTVDSLNTENGRLQREIDRLEAAARTASAPPRTDSLPPPAQRR